MICSRVLENVKPIGSFIPLYAAKVVTDRVSGFSKGFGFVKYATIEDAESGIKGMDGQVNKDTLDDFLFKIAKVVEY